jgi:hypothetical protein
LASRSARTKMPALGVLWHGVTYELVHPPQLATVTDVNTTLANGSLKAFTARDKRDV